MIRSFQLAILFTLIAVVSAHAQSPTSQEAFAAAQKLYSDGKWAEALASFQNFETNFKFSEAVPEAIYLQGWCWYNLKRYDQALNLFQRMTKSYPTAKLVPEAMLKQAECYRELNNFSKAAEVYRGFQTTYQKHEMLPQAMLGEAWMLYKQKDLAGAKSVIEKVRTRFRDDPVVSLDALFLLGQIFSEEKNYAAARGVYKEIAAQRANPRASEGLFFAAETMFEAKRYDDAIAYYKRVQSKPVLLTKIQAELDALRAELPKRIAAGDNITFTQSRMDSLNQLAAQIKERPDLRASALFRIANCYQFLGKPEEATVVYRRMLFLYPDDPLAEKAHFGLIQTLTERKQLEKADAESKLFEKKYAKSALAIDTSYLQAETLFGTGQFAEALERYQKFRAASQNAQLIETAEFRITGCYYGLKQYDRARDAAATFIRNHPQSKLVPDALFRIGRSHFELSRAATDPAVIQNNLTEAVKYYELIRSQHTGAEVLPEVTFQLGYLYSYLGAYDKANFEKSIAAFQDFVTRWPNNRLAAEAKYQIARGRAALGQFDQAIAAYTQLVEQHPGSELAPFAAYEIASVYASEKKPERMIASLRAYVEKYPNHAKAGDAQFAIAAELENQKQIPQAIDEYRRLIARATASPATLTDDLRNAAIAAQVRVAGLLEQKGDIAGAVNDCAGFLSRMNTDATAARAMVGQIAAIYRRAKMFTQAYATLEQLAGQYQQNAAVRIAAASSILDVALGEKDFNRAYAGAAKLLADPEKDRLPAPSFLAAGNALLKMEKFAEARVPFEKALSLYANDPRTVPLASLGLGQADLGLKNYDQAEAAFNKVLTADAQSAVRPDAELGLAKVYEAKGKTKEAVDLYNKVMAAGRGEPASEAASRLGYFFFGQKDYKTALAYYLRVALLAGGPMGEEAALRAAQCHEGLGNVDAARSAYQSFLRRFPKSTLVPEAQKRLSALPAPKPQQ